MQMLFLPPNSLLKKEGDTLVWLFCHPGKKGLHHSWSRCLSPVRTDHQEAFTDLCKLKACLKSCSCFLTYSWRVITESQNGRGWKGPLGIV